jgi:hypothetical protein
VGQLGYRLPNPHVASDLEYTVLMNTNTPTAFAPAPFRLSFDFSTEGHDNVWEAMAATLVASIQPDTAILRAEYIGLAPNGWPTASITFASIECAKAFTYAYLGYTLDNAKDWDVHTDDEVGEYVAFGEFVTA